MELEELKKKINEDFNNLKLNLQTLTELRAQYLGKKGPIQEMLLEMKNLPFYFFLPLFLPNFERNHLIF